MSTRRNSHLTLAELCGFLSISEATGRNWLRLGRLIPSVVEDNRPYFTREYAGQVLDRLKSSPDGALQSRRNKTYVHGNISYRSYIPESSPNAGTVRALSRQLAVSSISLTDAQALYFVAECALQLLLQASDCTHSSSGCVSPHIAAGSEPAPGSILRDYLDGCLPLTREKPLIEPLLDSHENAEAFMRTYPCLFGNSYRYVPGEDTLGLLLQTLHSAGSRKACGAYYTPAPVARTLIDGLFPENESSLDGRLLEPCCGTGNFLLQLPRTWDFRLIFAADIDAASVYAARIQAAIHFQVTDIELLFSHIICCDFLQFYPSVRYDYIIGNPPWGYAFTEEDCSRLRQHYHCAERSRPESSDLFWEHAIDLLKPSGTVSFIVPEAILTVRRHLAVRKLILETCIIRRVNYLGETFEHVHCPAIILQCRRSDSDDSKQPRPVCGLTVSLDRRSFVIQQSRFLQPDYLCFHADDTQYSIVRRLNSTPDAVFLKQNADFALGIVTGDNRSFLSGRQLPGMEPVYRGSCIDKYHIRETKDFLTFLPERFQQTGSEELYRAPEKLLYRFIGKKLVFAYDNKQRLTLNSCNLLIPHIAGLHIKYILAILNSRMAQFLVDMQYHSVKLLRSHIEALPIPYAAPDKQTGIVSLVEQLEASVDIAHTASLYDRLDCIISGLYGLSQDEYNNIRASVEVYDV